MGAARRRRAIALCFTFAGTVLLPGTVSTAASRTDPPCFGAAARDAAVPCDSSPLRFRATPVPDDAELQPGSPCAIVKTTGAPTRVCQFGLSKQTARATVALLGDSHAPAWRGAVDGLARAERWRGLTVRRSSCPFTLAARFADEPGSSECFAWVKATTAFFVRHREIHTVFVVVASGYPWKPGEGTDPHTAAVAGFRQAFDALPPSVRHIVVIRDNPLARDDTLACVDGALARHRRPDLRCAIPRSDALVPDAAADAVDGLAGDRGRLIDLTSAFCDPTRCFTVVGGVLVYRDRSHLTQTFSASLGPLLTRAYQALGVPVD